MGLQPGESVVMNGQLAVMPGGKVRVVSRRDAYAGDDGSDAGQS